jgi:hypothetical protein
MGGLLAAGPCGMMKPKEIPVLMLKRAELIAEINIAERRVASLRVHLASIEATIGVFAFAHTPAGRAERRQHAAESRRGQISRAILDILRRADQPLLEREIVERIAVDRGLHADLALTRKVRAALSRRTDGSLVRNGAQAWALVRQP